MQHKVIPDPEHGYMRLDPIPDDTTLNEFYQSKYYDLIRKGGRAQELRRLMVGGKEKEREQSWLCNTLYSDMHEVFTELGVNGSLLDIGCGPGVFMSYMAERGWEVAGLEPSEDACKIAHEDGLTVYNSDLEKFASNTEEGTKRYNAVTMLNVLEHVPDPMGVLNMARKLLVEDGTLFIRVPNDFSELQLSTHEKLEGDRWWVAVPDHINYFNFESLGSLLHKAGYEVVYSQSDFPMEMFLLMGDNYVGNPEVGDACHKKRVAFETGIPGKLRRKLYRTLGHAGFGRSCLMYARPTA